MGGSLLHLENNFKEIGMEYDELTKVANEAYKVLTESQAIMQQLVDEFVAEADGPIAERAQMLQLILQYRLDAQDALVILLQIDNGLLQILGIDTRHSSQVNLERMAFALGQDDLKQILRALSLLVTSLLRIAHRSQYHASHAARKLPGSRHENPVYAKQGRQLKKAVDLQQVFLNLMIEFKRNVKQLVKRAAIGPVLDHIAALRGPVSQFFQAIQHGLTISHDFYAKFNTGLKEDKTIGAVLQEVEVVLQQIPSLYQHHQLFTPVRQDLSERLEQRATEKRLGHFFRY
ncbi:hypothetical protein [Legionella oakridgensis]|uniref:hypothetical protein n=1 Tax=Legionella oakridgensis TaxID=29423 RepID=UPI0003DDF966|nr:hypothetical protein [Legionella oakridgensis]ETO92464.1 hypothetical protein LOR_65c18220 [Legionella oakridgensis RV-2-2007]